MQHSNHGRAPSTLHIMDGVSSEVTSSSPPSFMFCFLMPKKRDGSITDRNLYTPWFPSGIHSWLSPPFFYHWTTLAPLVFFCSAISRHWPFNTLWMTTPLPCFTNLHLWFHLLFRSHWIRRSPFFQVAPGTSRALPDWLLMIKALCWTVGFFTSTNRNIWVSLFRSKSLYLSTPSNSSAVLPLASVLIQQQVKNSCLACTTAKS